MIAAGNPHTAQVGAQILASGGNAVDAAVASTFASCLSEIAFVHLGGSGIALLHDPATQSQTVYDFFSSAPGLGLADPSQRVLDFHRVTVSYGPTTQDFYHGRGSVAVPGNIFGLCRMQQDLGRLTLDQVLDPAIRLAREGVVLDRFQAQTCRMLAPLYSATPSIRRVFEPDGSFLEQGDRVLIPDLPKSLLELRDSGAGCLTGGALGEAVVRDQSRRGGLLTSRDLTSYRTRRPTPVRVAYGDYEILLPPPSSTGGPLTALALTLLQHFKVGDLNWGGTAHLSILAEVMAATSRTRQDWDRLVQTGDPGEAVSRLLKPARVRRELGRIETALESARPGPIADEPNGPAATTHVSVVDETGMAVSLTHSAGESAGYVVPGTGLILNNIMGEEDLHPQGFHKTVAGTRIATMMTPILIMRDGQVQAVLGTGGSTRIRTAVLQVVSNLVDFELPLQDAVDRPRVHYENGILQCEGGSDPAAILTLERRGYRVNVWNTRSVYFGGTHCVVQAGLGGRREAVGDPRRGGAVA